MCKTKSAKQNKIRFYACECETYKLFKEYPNLIFCNETTLTYVSDGVNT